MVPFETSGMLLSKEDASGLLGEVRMVDADDGLAGEYVFRRELAKGATATVFLGDRVSDGHRVAIKRVSKAELSRVEYKRVQCECKRLGSLHHPNIVQLVEVVEERSNIFIITSFIDGCSIEELLIAPMRRPKPMLEELARRLFSQLLRVLDFMHSRDLVHRDIKPANLLVDSRFERLYLCDFGLCTNIDRARGPRKRAPCGTLLYAAPELLTTGVYLGPEIDMWSCGVTLFAMLTGVLPFYHPTDRGQVRAAIRSGLYEWPAHSDVSDLARDLVDRLLTVSPDERCTLESALAHPWLQPARSDLRSAYAGARASPSPSPSPSLREKLSLSSDGGADNPRGLISRVRSSLGRLRSPPPDRPRGDTPDEGEVPRVSSFDRRLPQGRSATGMRGPGAPLNNTIEVSAEKYRSDAKGAKKKGEKEERKREKNEGKYEGDLDAEEGKGYGEEGADKGKQVAGREGRKRVASSSVELISTESVRIENTERKTSASSFSSTSECEKVERVISFKVIEVEVVYMNVKMTMECHEAMTRKQFKAKAQNLLEVPKGEKIFIYCFLMGEYVLVKSTEQLQKLFTKPHSYFEIKVEE